MNETTRIIVLSLKMCIKNIKSYFIVFLMLTICTVLINVNLSGLFAKARYTDDISHFADKEAYILSQFETANSSIPTLSDNELSAIHGISRVISCNCGRTTLSGLTGITTEKKQDDVYVAYTTNGYTDDVKIDLIRGRLPAKRDDGIYEILVSQSLSNVLVLNKEYVFREFDDRYNVLVVGVLAHGGVFLSLTGMGNASSYFKEITADPGWIIIPKEHSYIKSYIKIIFFEKSLSSTEKEELISKLNTEYGYIYSFDSVDKELSESVHRDILEKLPLCGMLTLICFISISGCISLNIVKDLKSYAIFRIHGASKETCFAVASMTNIAVVVSALLFSVPVFRLYTNIALKQPLYISWRNYIITFLIFACIFLVSSLIPRALINKTIVNLYNEA